MGFDHLDGPQTADFKLVTRIGQGDFDLEEPAARICVRREARDRPTKLNPRDCCRADDQRLPYLQALRHRIGHAEHGLD